MTRGKSAAAFCADLRAFSARVKQDVAEARREVATELFEKIVARTPVDSGRLRASWIMTDGAPSREVPPVGATGEGRVAATFAEPFDVTWIVNNQPYAGAVEYGGLGENGKTRAPGGMVRLSLAEMTTNPHRLGQRN